MRSVNPDIKPHNGQEKTSPELDPIEEMLWVNGLFVGGRNGFASGICRPFIEDID